ncbi:MAG: type VI secretion system ATPase TssH, partial [Chloroflexi bacterium]|nr:type VI secretion system ATPase TssH [Chloroflexota bacterium]
FLNRVDDIIIFKPLSREDIRQIVLLLIEELRQRLAERRLGLELSPAAADFIAETAYDPVYGARPLKRFLQHQLETRIGRALISGEVAEGGTLQVDVEKGQLVVKASVPS